MPGEGPALGGRDEFRKAVAHALRAPSEHNAQPWRWRLHANADVLDLRADHTRRLPSTDQQARSMLLGCGCSLHHLRVALAAAGRSAEVRHGNDGDAEHPLARVRLLPGGASDVRQVRWFDAIPIRRTDRRRFAAREVDPDVVEQLAEAARTGGGTLHLLVGKSRRVVLDAAREADHVQLARDDYAGELQHWTHRLAGARDGIPASSRPGTPAVVYGDVAMRWMAPGTLDHPRARPDQHEASLVLLVAAPSDDTVSLVRAGESLSAVLLEAAALGLGVTPFAHPFEVPETRERVRRLALGVHRVPAIALRVGWPPTGAATIPPTPRRPLNAVLVEDA